MKACLPLFFVFCSSMLSAQIKWFETGQQWKFCHQLGWTGWTGCDSVTIGGDTVVAGKICKQLGAWGFAYEISDKVFIYAGNGGFTKVFDFDMIEGETLDVGVFTYQVDSIMVVNLGDFAGVRVQKAHVVGDPFRNISTFYIAEGIGMLRTLGLEAGQCVCSHIFPIYFTCDFDVADGEDTYLSVFRQGSKVYFPADTLVCDNVEIKTNTPFQHFNVQIQPNPVSTTCYLKYELPFLEADLTLFSCTGVFIRRWPGLPETIDLTSCHPGLYFLSLQQDGRIVWTGKITKQ